MGFDDEQNKSILRKWFLHIKADADSRWLCTCSEIWCNFCGLLPVTVQKLSGIVFCRGNDKSL